MIESVEYASPTQLEIHARHRAFHQRFKKRSVPFGIVLRPVAPPAGATAAGVVPPPLPPPQTVIPEVRPPKKLSAEEIQRVVAEFFGIEVKDLLGPCRKPAFARPRQIAMYLCRKLLSGPRYSYPGIGRFFKRDHTTVLASVQKIADEIQCDLAVGVEVNRIIEKFAGIR